MDEPLPRATAAATASSARSGWALGALLAAAGALRVAWVLAVPSKPVGDFAMYWETARHLREHGALPADYPFMPGWPAVLAVVQALGGGFTSARLLGALAGTALVFFAYVIARRLWCERAAWLSGGLCALWPGGIAFTSVLGTDLPAACALACAVWLLVRRAPHPRVARGCALALGIGAYLRAILLPLAPLALLGHLRGPWIDRRDAQPPGERAEPRAAARARWRPLALALGASALCAATLLPWGLRNLRAEGRFHLLDAHGGLTALVGAYPNQDGRFTRSLNHAFGAVTGQAWLAPPHRQADETAYRIARDFRRVSPPYALGLALLRVDKLLGDERSLLYWPAYRAGVLPDEGPGSTSARWLARHRARLERITDGFYAALMCLALAGYGLAIAHRRWRALVPLAFQAALAGVYVIYFAESRYHLPIVALAFPAAGGVLARLTAGSAGRRGSTRARLAAQRVLPLALPLAGLLGLSAATSWGQRLVDRHRWAAPLCQLGDAWRFCPWRPTGAGTPSPVRGHLDGAGLDLRPGEVGARTDLQLAPGSHRLTARLGLARLDGHAASEVPDAACALRAAGAAPLPFSLRVLDLAGTLALATVVEVPASPAPPAPTAVTLSCTVPGQGPARARLWLEELRVVRAASP